MALRWRVALPISIGMQGGRKGKSDSLGRALLSFTDDSLNMQTIHD